MAEIFKSISKFEAVLEKLTENSVVKKIHRTVKENRIFVKLSCFCLIGIISVIISLVSSGITFGFSVKYDGQVIATVKDTGTFKTAKDIVVENVNSDNAGTAIATPEFKLTLTVSDRLDDPLKLADAIIENSDEIISAFALLVNGETVVCVEEGGLEEYLETGRNRYIIEGAESVSSFIDNVEVVKGYYIKSDITQLSDAMAVIDGLQVKTVSTVTTDTEIPFSKMVEKTSAQPSGYSKVTVAGETGIKRTVESVETINGVESARSAISSYTVKSPVTQVTTIGTGKQAVASTQRSAGFIFPLRAGSYYVSAYYGDGRGHKGIDLAADKGSPIFAVASGTVTFAGVDGAYGYSVVIDHGNGLSTRYAHASSLCVSKGSTVSQGDVVALVGRTGNATGNHLHFEVMVNGSKVNPASFIGL